MLTPQILRCDEQTFAPVTMDRLDAPNVASTTDWLWHGLIPHHPRKSRPKEGNSTRGNGSLLAAVDIIVELSAYGKLRSD